MKFHAPTRQLTISYGNLEKATLSLLYAISQIRESAGLPLTKYKQEGLLTSADHAQKAIIDAANDIGIDLGAQWGNELDVSDVG